MSSNAFITQIKNQIDLHLGVDGKPPLNVDGEAFVVSLYGEWGIGKTHCLKALEALYQEALQATVKNDSAKSITIPVMFSPWRFEKEQHLIVPLVKTIQAKLEELIKADFLADPKKKGLLEHLKNTGTSLANMALSLAAGFKFKVSLLGLIEGDLDFDKTLKHDKEKHKEIKEAEEKARKKQLSPKAESLYYDTLTWLKKLCQPSKENAAQPALRFVLFIDDLDRCLPEKAVEMLESIKLFLDIPSFAFVIGVDNEVIERGIRHRYDAYLKLDANHLPITGHEYLEKIIHLPLMLPRMRVESARAWLLETYGEPLIKALSYSGKVHLSALEAERENLLDLLLRLVPLVPRKLIRATQGLIFQLGLTPPDYNAKTVLRVIVMQQLYPSLYKLVKADHKNFIRISRVRYEHGTYRIKADHGAWISLKQLNKKIEKFELEDAPLQSDQSEEERLKAAVGDLKRVAKEIYGEEYELPKNEDIDDLRVLTSLLVAIASATDQRGANSPLSIFDTVNNEAPTAGWSSDYLHFSSLTPTTQIVQVQKVNLLQQIEDALQWTKQIDREQALVNLDFLNATPNEWQELLSANVFNPSKYEYRTTLQDETWWEDISAKIKTCIADVQKVWNAAAAKRMKDHQLVSPRYQLEDDHDPAKAKEVRDLKTGLIWRRLIETYSSDKLDQSGFTFEETQKMSDQQNDGKAWFVPSLEELASLAINIPFNRRNRKATIDHEAFPNTPKRWFWSSTKINDTNSARAYNFGFGGAEIGYLGGRYCVRLVRPSAA